jgi:beta-N-acetylhexosaminidase
MTGPVILDLIGPELSADEKELLQHPLVGGVILFARHYQSPEQIQQLCQSIRAARANPILITVDQEGGRVQRFKEGFTILPPMEKIGKLYEKSPAQALTFAEECGWMMASELLSVGVDLSFAPVLDLNKKICPAIGDRAFHEKPAVIIALANALIKGMNHAGMAATGKHFPGHGSVPVDSHRSLPIDNREWNDIEKQDFIPFQQLIQNKISAIMPAHILFSKIDDKPVGFSKHWLQDILRKQLQFSGVIVSDDLNMSGADIIGNYAERAQAALDAGCDMILICNNRTGVLQILDHLPQNNYILSEQKFNMLQGKISATNLSDLKSTKIWQERNERILNC